MAAAWTTWACMGGKIYKTGARVTAEELGERPVLLEYAGPQGEWKRGKKREVLHILWRYDWEEGAWKEIARAFAFGSEWVAVLREPAIRALKPVNGAEVNSVDRGREVSDKLVQAIDDALEGELPEVRAAALAVLYGQVAARLVAA